jgi:short-subunit dehydrogenase
MSSLVAFQGVPRAATYAATKAFIQTFAEGLRLELSSSGVDVVASAPGPVRTGFEARADMRMSAAAGPAVVARATLDALGHRTTVRPGFLSKFLEASLLPLPRLARSRIMSVVMGGMTRHQDDGKKHQDARFA